MKIEYLGFIGGMLLGIFLFFVFYKVFEEIKYRINKFEINNYRLIQMRVQEETKGLENRLKELTNDFRKE